MNSWIEQLMPIIIEYKDGDEDSLDGDGVDDLCRIIKAKINLQEGNITEDEYANILDRRYEYAQCEDCIHKDKKSPCPCDSCEQSIPSNFAEEDE